MRLLLLVLLTLLAAVFLAQLAQYDAGYVAIGYGGWVVQSSLSLFLIGLLVTMAVIYILVRLMIRTWGMPRAFSGWRSRRRTQRSQKALYSGFLAMAEGDWRTAERLLIGHAGSSETPLIHYLGAARSAQQLDASDRRDTYLRQAHEQVPDADLAVGLVQAELQISQSQQEQALATLAHLRELSPGNHQVLKLLLQLRMQLHEWEELLKLLPELKRRGVINANAFEQTERQAWLGVLNDSGDANVLLKNWKRLPKRYQSNTELIICYSELSISLDAGSTIESLLRLAIKRNHDPRLVTLYGELAADDGVRQLGHAESWLNGHQDDPALHLALGRICLRNKLWGKAQGYLEKVVELQPSPPAYRLLAQVQEEMGDNDAAATSFRKGLELATNAGQGLVAVS